MRELKVYLSGASLHASDGNEGRDWREQISEKLKKIAEWTDCNINIVDPIKRYNYSEHSHISGKEIKEYFLYQIKTCDLVIINLDDSDKSVGSGQEVQFAVDNKIPIIGFGTKNMYNWLMEDCMAYRKNMTEILDYIRDYFMKGSD